MIKVLHVEDDTDIREIARIALSISGEFDIIQCSCAEDGLKQLEEFQPDVFLLDLMMPGMTGMQMLDRINEIHILKCIPVIFMTGRTQRLDTEKLREAGAVSVICKPFDPLLLGSQIKAAIAFNET